MGEFDGKRRKKVGSVDKEKEGESVERRRECY